LFLGDLNTLFIFFFFILGSLLINTNTALHLLLTAELLWITLYSIVLFVGLVYDNLNILSLTFFFLIFSAIEFGVGLVLLLLQHILLRTLNLNDSETNIFKFVNRFNRQINTNRINWKL
jgi:NADH:ubiquinone oxidoreductase subunit K